MNVLCPFCGALHWISEKLTASSARRPLFGTCCQQGKISLQLPQDPPRDLYNLFTQRDALSKEFIKHIRMYNSAFAFTSLGVKLDYTVNAGTGPYCFKIQGELHHHLGSLCPPNQQQPPRYAQIYIYDSTKSIDIRMQNNSAGNQQIMLILQSVLEANPMTARFKNAFEILQSQQNVPQPQVALRLIMSTEKDQRRYNLPTAQEVAVVMPGHGDDVDGNTYRDIILHLKDGPLKRINELNPLYLPLHYVLLFPRGELGWHPNIALAEDSNNRGVADANQDDSDGHPGQQATRRVTQLQWYSYQLHIRERRTMLFYASSLFQQFIVDAWAQLEQDRLNYYKTHQEDFRIEQAAGVIEALPQDRPADLQSVGRAVYLPSSFVGGARYMFQLLQDSLAVARFYGKIDYFLTMTANPQWKEITNELLPGQSASDRPDLVARVFHTKMTALLNDITKNGFLGNCVAHIHTIEFQKRGLPHMHLLIIVAEDSRVKEPADVDNVIRAEFPDPNVEPLLYEKVLKYMVHSCGARCQDSKGKCSKRFPKAFCSTTSMTEETYCTYKRRDDGRRHRRSPNSTEEFHNGHVVPYNPVFLIKYDCHINVECCVSIKSVKYIHKYIYKGHDRTTLEQDVNEVKAYIDARYVSANEAVWRLFRFRLHEEKPSVERLPVHLPGQQNVVFTANNTSQEILNRIQNKVTKLMAYFNYYHDNPDSTKYLYQEFPQHFVWINKTQKWKPRKQQFALGRMYFVPPREGERFYLRLLLTVVSGAQSFEHLRLINGVQYTTFQEACRALGILDDDREWQMCLEDAAHFQTGYQLRRLFVTILYHCTPSEPHLLWDQYREKICDDLAHQLRTKYQINNPTEFQVYDFGLFLIDEQLRKISSKGLEQFQTMPQPQENWSQVVGNRLIAAQRNYNAAELAALANEEVAKMNQAQQVAFNSITSSVYQDKGTIFFLNGPAGTGKTFCYNALCHRLRGENMIVLCVASSGIAALLLQGGRTAHSMFKIPLDVGEGDFCNIKKNSMMAELLKITNLIIWDEVPMQHRFGPEAVDRTLQDIRGSPRQFGGVTVVFGGDFQQILPVIIKGSRESIVGACLRKSPLWQNIQVLHLTENMRLAQTPEDRAYGQFLLDIGHGKNLPMDNTISLPQEVKCGSALQDLMDQVYPNLAYYSQPLGTRANLCNQYFLERTILSAKNEDVDAINNAFLRTFRQEDIVTYYSADEAVLEEGVDDPGQNYPIEYLNSITYSGLPLHKLQMKVGCPLMLLRNLDPEQGLCNGTRCILTRCTRRVLEVRILGGDHHGQTAFIPRITLQPPEAMIGFVLNRRQFPVRLAFAMTINKSQGQSVKNIGIDLRTPVFTHGQLYVALSRCTSKSRVKILFPSTSDNTTTTNIVYPEVLL